MKKYYYLKNYLLFYLLCYNQQTYTKNIEVLLEKYSIKENCNHLQFENIKKISDYDDIENYYNEKNNTSSLTYNIKTKAWYLNNKKLKIKNIALFPDPNEYIFFKNNMYQGKIIIKCDNNYIYIINDIDLELYVASVVAKEFYAEWNIEALKTAAVTVRTYALHKINEAIKLKHPFHIKSSIEHQKYEGFTQDIKIYNAVEKTKGKIISYHNKPILSMYHVCCGGVIPTECVGFDFKKYPYLQRKKKCTGCEDYRNYFWQNNIEGEIVCQKLSHLINKIVLKIKNIKKITYSKSGTVRRLHIEIEILNKKNKKETIMVLLTNKDLRKLFNIHLSSYSSCFTINFNYKLDIEINGRGHGHHIGLCQRGMHGYSKKAWNMEKIIEFYYPGTTIINM